MFGYIGLSWTDIVVNDFLFSAPIGLFFVSFGLMFSIGCLGLFWRSDNLLTVLAFGELMLVSAVFGFVIVSKFLAFHNGQIYALTVLAAAAVESAIALILILNVFRTNGSVSFYVLQNLRG